MEKIMLFQKNASVVDANGEQVGSLERVVLNPESKLVTDIVIRTGTLFNKTAKVVPVKFIVETAENQIVLSPEAGEFDAFPLFEEHYLVAEDGDIDQKPADVPQVVYGNPGFGPMIVQAPGEQVVTQVEQHIPQGTVAMKEGAKVITADGKHVGNVERVLADASLDQVTNLEISKGLLTKEWRLIPMKWVKTVGEDEVTLRVNEAAIDDE
jgi:uncharacterized protein YrrD